MNMNRSTIMVMMSLLLTAGSIIAQDIQRTQPPTDRKEIISTAMPEIVAARAFRTQKKYDEAIQSYKSAIEKYPNTIDVPTAYLEIGHCYKIQGIDAKTSEYYKKAIPLFEKIIAASDSKQPAYYQANKGLAVIYIQLENSELAIGYLNQLGEFEGLPIFEMVELGAYWMNLAEIYEKQEKWEDAISTYHQTLERFIKMGDMPNMGRVHAKLAACYKKLQNWKAAIKEAQKQIDMAERYLKDHPDLQESKREKISQGIQTSRMEIKEMRKMQGGFVLPVLVGVGIIAIGGLLLLLRKRVLYMNDIHLYNNHQQNPLDIKQLAEFDATIANLTQSEQRRRRVIYLRDAAEKIKVGKSFLKGFGWFMIPFAIIPIFWPFFAILWYFRKKAGSMMEIQFKNALDYWSIHESLIDDYLSEDSFD